MRKFAKFTTLPDFFLIVLAFFLIVLAFFLIVLAFFLIVLAFFLIVLAFFLIVLAFFLIVLAFFLIVLGLPENLPPAFCVLCENFMPWRVRAQALLCSIRIQLCERQRLGTVILLLLCVILYRTRGICQRANV
jgi:hypothetical protein